MDARSSRGRAWVLTAVIALTAVILTVALMAWAPWSSESEPPAVAAPTAAPTPYVALCERLLGQLSTAQTELAAKVIVGQMRDAGCNVRLPVSVPAIIR